MPDHDHTYNISLAEIIKLNLLDGRHTSFHLLRCECGHPFAFPPENLAIAIAEGTEETGRRLRELGLVE